MSTISKPYTFSAGATIVASEHNSNFDTIINDYNGGITNVNISGSAAIGASKLNLSTIAQDIEFTGTLNFSGATITAATTFASLIATTADINGGTIDGAAIGAASPSTGHFTELSLGSGVAVVSIKDEDDMASDSATAIPTQQSVKSYVDNISLSDTHFLVRLTAEGSQATWDETGGYDVGADFASSDYVAPSTGKYFFSIVIEFNADGTNSGTEGFVQLRKNTTIIHQVVVSSESFPSAGKVHSIILSVLVDATASDTFDVNVDAGGDANAKTTVNDITKSFWSGFKLPV